MMMVLAIFFLLLFFSAVGTCNWLRIKWHLPAATAFSVYWCGLGVLIWVSGLLHLMVPTAYLILGIGLWLLVCQMKKAFHLERGLLNVARPLFRREYIFLFLILVMAALAFGSIKHVIGGWDYYGAWYPQYAFMITSGHWSNGEYSNYASYYCMIVNAAAYYIGRLTGFTGSHVYSFSLFVCCLAGLSGFLGGIRWSRVSLISVMLLTGGYWYYIFSGEGNPLVYLAVVAGLAGIAWLGQYFILRKSRLRFSLERMWSRDTLTLIFYCLAGAFFILAPFNFIEYPFDAVLCCLVICPLALYVTWMDFGRKHRSKLLWLLPILLFGTMAKPTGILFTLPVSLMIFIMEILRFKRPGIARKRLLVQCLVLVFMPLVIFKVWGWYSDYHQLRLQHRLSNQWKEETLRDWRDGMSEERSRTWRKKIAGMGNMHYNSVKLPLSVALERRLYSALEKVGLKPDGVTPERRVHISFIILMFSGMFLFSLLLNRSEWGGKLLLFACLLLFSFVIFIIQFYFGPQYWGVPGLYRYISPAIALLGAVSWGAWMVAARAQKQFGKFLVLWGLLVVLSWPLIAMDFQTGRRIRNLQFSYALAATLAAEAGGESTVAFCADNHEAVMASNTIAQIRNGFRGNVGNMPLTYPYPNRIDPNVVYLMFVSNNRKPMARAGQPAFFFEDGGFAGEGVYQGRYLPEDKQIHFQKLSGTDDWFARLDRWATLNDYSSIRNLIIVPNLVK